MYEVLDSTFQVLISNTWVIVPAAWACFAAYFAWYFTRAKRYSPLTKMEARQLWAIHRLDAGCEGKKWRQVRDGKRTVGFECECGYRHVQQRLLVAHAPAAALTGSQVSPFDKLHTTHKSA